MFPLPIFHYFEWAALLTSVLFYHKIKDKPLRWFIPFLLLMVITETSGRYMHYVLKTPNSWIYNIFITIEAVFYIYLFYCYFENKRSKQFANYLLYLWPIFALVNVLFIQGFFNIGTNLLKVSAGFYIVLSILYFIDIFNNKNIVNPFTQPMFWVATGLLFFNLGSLAYYLFFDYILAHRNDPKALIFLSIKKNLIYILYSCIIMAILSAKKTCPTK